MGKLRADQFKEYFATHLPYTARILVAHCRMTRLHCHDDRAQRGRPLIGQAVVRLKWVKWVVFVVSQSVRFDSHMICPL